MKHWLKRLYFYVSWPGLAVYFAWGTRARVIITDTQGQVLLVQGKWRLWYDDRGLCLPGGGVHKGEAPAQAALRELSEELGIRADVADLTVLGTVRASQYGIASTVHLFGLQLTDHPTLRLQRSEIVSARWYSNAELAGKSLKPEVSPAIGLLARKG